MVLADETAGWASAAAAVVIAVAGALARLVHSALMKKISEATAELETRMKVAAESERHGYGESVLAVRQKISDMELWNRDNFVNKRTFDGVMADTRDTLRRMEDKIERGFDRIDRKLNPPVAPEN